MSQIGESVAVIPPGGPEACIFCGAAHQHTKGAATCEFGRDMYKLKKEGREFSRAQGNRAAMYPHVDLPPLVKWESDITKTGGYKAAAHHCIALKSVSGHAISGELKEAGYDPNGGNNCSWLPYSQLQFSRARAYHKPLQKHRGGHIDAYFDKVVKHINQIQVEVHAALCSQGQKADKASLLYLAAVQEEYIWCGLASPAMEAYFLYNNSYLDPTLPWGSYAAEEGKTETQLATYPAHITELEDDVKAEEESADDPE